LSCSRFVEHEERLAIGEVGGEAVRGRRRGRRVQVQGVEDRRRDELGVSKRLERHECRAAGESSGRETGHLLDEPGLACATRSRNGDQARLSEQPLGRIEVGVSADEARQRGRHIEARAAERSERWKRRRQALDDELEQVVGAGQVLEPMLAEIMQAQAGWQNALDECDGGGGQQHLAAVAGRSDTGRAMDIDANVIISRPVAFARVEADPYRDASIRGPVDRGEVPLAGRRGYDRVLRARENDEEGIAFGPLLPAPMGGEDGSERCAVALEECRPIVPEALDEMRRAFDVGEQEGDGSRRGSFRRAHDRRLVRHGRAGSTPKSQSIRDRAGCGAPRRDARH
jgi:hypothetical protein